MLVIGCQYSDSQITGNIPSGFRSSFPQASGGNDGKRLQIVVDYFRIAVLDTGNET
jgi:hypothetical protein